MIFQKSRLVRPLVIEKLDIGSSNGPTDLIAVCISYMKEQSSENATDGATHQSVRDQIYPVTDSVL